MLFPGYPLHRHLTSWFIPISACYVILWQHDFPTVQIPSEASQVEISWDPYQSECLSICGCWPLAVAPAGCCSCSVLCVTLPQSVPTLSLTRGLSHQPTYSTEAAEAPCSWNQMCSLAGLSGWPLVPFPAGVGTIPCAGFNFISHCVDFDTWEKCTLVVFWALLDGHDEHSSPSWWYLLLAEPALLLAGAVLVWN